MGSTDTSAAIEKYITGDGTVRIASVVATGVVEECQKVHESTTIATSAMGRAIIGAGLLASFQKEDEARVALYFKGDGPLGQLFAEGEKNGAVRAFVSHPKLEMPAPEGKIQVGLGIGKGVLTVSTLLPPGKKPYTGTVPLQSGEVAEDIAYYLFQSQQIPSIVALGVSVDSSNKVLAAGGTIVQVMPGANEETVVALEKRVQNMRPVTDMVREGATAKELVCEVFEDLSFHKVDDNQPTNLKYACNCNITRVEKALLFAGSDEIKALIEKAEPAQVTCDFCGRRYGVGVPRLKVLLEKVKKES